MCALFAHECNSFKNSYFVQLLHFTEIKFRIFFLTGGKRIRPSRQKSQKNLLLISITAIRGGYEKIRPNAFAAAVFFLQQSLVKNLPLSKAALK